MIGNDKISYAYFPAFVSVCIFWFWVFSQVDWDDEQRCFEGVANEISEFFSDFSHFLDGEAEDQGGGGSNGTRTVPEKYENLLQVKS